MASIKTKLCETGVKFPENNIYELNLYKSYAISFTTEVGHSTTASCVLTRDWYSYMFYSQTRQGHFVSLPGNITGF